MSDAPTLAPTKNAAAVALARLAVVTGANDRTGDAIVVQFNPASLQLQLSNELKDTKNNERKQYIAKASAKLTMELPFDTTDTGADVTAITRQLQAFLVPQMPKNAAARQQKPPPLVLFEWGTLRFKGVAEGYRETIDFFSASGVPLRASVNLTLSRQDQVFDQSGGGAGATPPGTAKPETFNLATPGGGASKTAGDLDAPGAARGLAAANGEENLRFGAGGSLDISAGITLKPAAAFSAGGGFGIGGGAGFGIGGGVGASFGGSASAGAGIGVGFGAGGGAGFGASASAGAGIGGSAGFSTGISGTARLSASEGAFAGLRVSGPTVSASASLDPEKLLSAASNLSPAIDAGSTFHTSGRVTPSGARGLRADVGASGRLSFD